MDKTVAPCDDFYAYACGGWMKATPIPEDEASWVRSFSVIHEDNQKALRAILDRDAAGDTQADAYGKQLGDFWASCMDESAIEHTGLDDLKPELHAIDGGPRREVAGEGGRAPALDGRERGVRLRQRGRLQRRGAHDRRRRPVGPGPAGARLLLSRRRADQGHPRRVREARRADALAPGRDAEGRRGRRQDRDARRDRARRARR